MPIAFERGEGVFGETVDRFIEDLTTKSVSVSRRPSMDAYRDDGFISRAHVINLAICTVLDAHLWLVRGL